MRIILKTCYFLYFRCILNKSIWLSLNVFFVLKMNLVSDKFGWWNKWQLYLAYARKYICICNKTRLNILIKHIEQHQYKTIRHNFMSHNNLLDWISLPSNYCILNTKPDECEHIMWLEADSHELIQWPCNILFSKKDSHN